MMDGQRNSLMNSAYYYNSQAKNFEELKHSLLYTTLELEATKMAAREELRRRDEQLAQLRNMLRTVIKERDEAKEKCDSLILETLLNNQSSTAPPNSVLSSVDDAGARGCGGDGFSSSDCDESIVSSPATLNPAASRMQTPSLTAETALSMLPEKPLPEKGKLLQAVIKAGPLLRTLLLAGPLPQWRHPPPPINPLEIPPVGIPPPPITTGAAKRPLLNNEATTLTKFPRILLQ